MAQQQVSAVQIQMAAAAGVELLSNNDLPVPMSIAKSGSLSILEAVLQAISRGELVVAAPPREGEQQLPDIEGAETKLKAVQNGGKPDEE